jgi:type I restriction enzyme, S subunit
MITMEKKNSLPQKGIWKTVTLGDVAEYINGRAFKPVEWEQQGIPIIRIQNLNNPNTIYNFTREHFEERYKIKNGDLLFAWSASLGAFIWDGKDAWLNQHIFKVVPRPCIEKRFLYYLLESIVHELYSKAHGSGMVHVTKSKFEATQIPLPTKGVQQQIVSKIEELFSELNKSIEELITLQKQLKVYRQAVLKCAFEGKLTNEVVKYGDLPEAWQQIELGKLCVIKRGKSKHRPRNEPSLFGGKYPFIQTGDIRNANGGQISNYTQTYSELGLQQSKLWPKGTLCITIAANIGETAILNFDACFPDSVVGLICNEEVLLTKYTNFFFISYKSKLKEMAPATAQKNINVEILERVEIPIPSIEEQEQIVQHIESRLSVCDKIEETITHSLQQAEALRQSILKKAFKGELIN